MRFKIPRTPEEIEADNKRFYYGCWVPMVLACATAVVFAIAVVFYQFFL
jgi:hypothetical protein